MIIWGLYHAGYRFGQCKTKYQAIKRLEKALCRYLNKPGDIIGRDYIVCGDYEAKRERIE